MARVHMVLPWPRMSTSVVFGMPREAIALGAAQAVLPLEQIGPQIVQILGEGARGTV